MASTLVPHYLGLALPMAFTAAIFMATAHMCDDNELDVMLVAGRSIARVAAPYFAMALLLCVFSLYLYGQLQPLAPTELLQFLSELRAPRSSTECRLSVSRDRSVTVSWSTRRASAASSARPCPSPRRPSPRCSRHRSRRRAWRRPARTRRW